MWESFFIDESQRVSHSDMKVSNLPDSDMLRQNQNQNCLLVIRPRTIIHQDLCLGELVPSPHKRSKLSN